MMGFDRYERMNNGMNCGWRHVVGSCMMKENGSSGGVVDRDNGD